MPIFEYECSACGHRLDALQKAGAGALRKCPECGRLSLHKMLSTPSFQLKGSGWRKPAAPEKGRKARGGKPKLLGHTLDSGPAHTHDDHDHGHAGHTHSHGGVTHTHGSGGKHSH
jgi:putative FmdB family regulatory protein